MFYPKGFCIRLRFTDWGAPGWGILLLFFRMIAGQPVFNVTSVIKQESPSVKKVPSPRFRSLRVESLESREMLAASVTSIDSSILHAQLERAGLSLTEEDILNLNSCEGASHTIYLDFDGHTTTNTQWNNDYQQNQPIITPRFTMDGDTSKISFTEMELLAIYEIWLRVSEDYLPFEVNVTTADPGINALMKSGGNDAAWGIRCCIGGSYNDWLGEIGGGISYAGSFNYSSDVPCFIFSESLSYHTKYIAEVVTHEAGHTLCLYHHDGNSLVAGQGEYYLGANGWAPIMGAAYYVALTQWSKGEYDGATNTDDELNIIATRNGFTWRSDDYGDTLNTAFPISIPSTDDHTGIVVSGIIERNTDVDFFSLDVTTDGKYSFEIGGMADITNLDVMVKLYNEKGDLIYTVNPSRKLNVEFTLELSPGTLYFSVEGTGDSEYYSPSDYGSLGAYTVTMTANLPVVVTTNEDVILDDEFISLREAVAMAGTKGWLPLITFAPELAGKTITMTGDAMILSRNITIDASSLYDDVYQRPGLTLDAASSNGIFIVNAGTESDPVILSGLALTNANSTENGGAILNNGTLTVNYCTLYRNSSEKDGGAIANFGDLVLAHSLVYDNTAAGFGGGIYSELYLTVINSTIVNNVAKTFTGGVYLLEGTAIFINSVVVLNRIENPSLDENEDVSAFVDITTEAALVAGGYSISSFTAWHEDYSVGNRKYIDGEMLLFWKVEEENYAPHPDGVLVHSGNIELAEGYLPQGATTVDIGGLECRPIASFDQASCSVNYGCDFYLSSSMAMEHGWECYWLLPGGEEYQSGPVSGYFSTDLMYVGPGTYEVGLKVVDQWGTESAPVYLPVVFLEPAPTVNVTKTEHLDGAVVQLKITVDQAMGLPVQEWNVDWSDGTVTTCEVWGTVLTVLHYFDTAGDYSISLKIKGGSGTFNGTRFELVSHHLEPKLKTAAAPVVDMITPGQQTDSVIIDTLIQNTTKRRRTWEIFFELYGNQEEVIVNVYPNPRSR